MGDAMADKEMPQHERGRAELARIVSAYDWGALGHVVDVGGGDGMLLIALLNEYPALRGTVVDLPETAETARKMLDAAGLAARADAVAGDYFAELPSGAEGYLLSSVVRDRSDEEARAILHNCASNAGVDAAVFVIEPLPDNPRDIPQLTALAESAGLTVTAVHETVDVAIVELALP
jgi:hypothetical protein